MALLAGLWKLFHAGAREDNPRCGDQIPDLLTTVDDNASKPELCDPAE
jgi:hypothetical protein